MSQEGTFSRTPEPRLCEMRCTTSMPSHAGRLALFQQVKTAQAAARMAPLKLLYFDIAGRAEMIRLALHIGGVDFEDVRIGREEFAAGKACE